MRKSLLLTSLVLGGALLGEASAQISTNPNKFLGNITTTYQMDTDGYLYSDLWNQVTPENETKWSSVEGTRGSFNWGSADNSYNYAKKHGFPFKFHCFAWGSQYPSWIESLTPKVRFEEWIKWVDAAKQHYPDLQLIDVVNEALSGHQQGTHFFEEALGGAGVSGYDWIVTAFEEVHKRWPDAILIYNDFNTFQWDTDRYIQLVQALIDSGAPIDAYGCQSHDLNDMSGTDFKKVMKKIHDALQIPMFISEYDINLQSDAQQKTRYKEQIPIMWEADYCAGVTIWGFIQGKTWEDYSGISYGKDREREAMKWLREYMATDKAKTAGFKEDFPFSNGWTKEASIYVKPSTIKPCAGDSVSITVRASMKTKTIDHVVLYIDKDSVVFNEAPYVTSYKATTVGKKSTLKAVVYTTDGIAYTRYSHITTAKKRTPYNGVVTELPGTLEAENCDGGSDGISFHDSDNKNEGDATSYRNDTEGVDIIKAGKGYGIGYTSSGEWLEYTVDITKPGRYLYAATVSSGVDNSGFTISIDKDGEMTEFASIRVPKTGDNDWSKYKTIEGKCAFDFEVGRHVIRIAITGSSCNIDKIELAPIEITNKINLEIDAEPSLITCGDPVLITINPTVLPDTIITSAGTEKYETATVKKIELYVNETLVSTMTSAPFTYTFTKTMAKGIYTVKAKATDSKRRESVFFEDTFEAMQGRIPYNGRITSRLEFENCDIQGEGYSFHDSDDIDEGGHIYRKDNEGVDIFTEDNRTFVGKTVEGEWLEYSVTVKETNPSTFTATVSSPEGPSAFNLCINDNGNLRPIVEFDIPQTAGWEKISVNSDAIPAGDYIYRVTIVKGGAKLDKIEIRKVKSEVELVSEDVRYQVYSLTGVSLGEVSADSEEAIADLTGRSGVYILKNITTGKSVRRVVGM